MMANTPRRKKQIGFRLSDEAREMLVRLASDAGIAQAAVLEVLIRDAVKRGGVIVAPPPHSQEEGQQ